MKKIILTIPHSHTWFWTQTCLSSLVRNPPVLDDDYRIDVIVINNSPWSPAIKGVIGSYWDMAPFWLTIIDNYKSNKFHASALDCIVESYDFDYLMAWETDVLALKPDWLQWFVDQMKSTDYAVGMWHHEQFVNPSCTLYRGDVLRLMNQWCKDTDIVIHAKDREELKEKLGKIPDRVPKDHLRWGPNFSLSGPIDESIKRQENPKEVLENMLEWIAGPFAEKRGFAEGTILKETPSGQLKGSGWYEPGQQLHHWATQAGYTYTICPTITTKRNDGLPLQTLYGSTMPDPERQLEAVEMFGNAYTAHVWGGTRALDILKHPVTCGFVQANTPMWLAREARFWKQVVPQEVQQKTLELIKKHGWHITGQGSDHVSIRDKEAAEYVRECYKEGGVEW